VWSSIWLWSMFQVIFTCCKDQRFRLIWDQRSMLTSRVQALGLREFMNVMLGKLPKWQCYKVNDRFSHVLIDGRSRLTSEVQASGVSNVSLGNIPEENIRSEWYVATYRDRWMVQIFFGPSWLKLFETSRLQHFGSSTLWEFINLGLKLFRTLGLQLLRLLWLFNTLALRDFGYFGNSTLREFNTLGLWLL
jgi:hypothetical protein